MLGANATTRVGFCAGGGGTARGRMTELEEEVRRLRQEVDWLRGEFEKFRAQFE